MAQASRLCALGYPTPDTPHPGHPAHSMAACLQPFLTLPPRSRNPRRRSLPRHRQPLSGHRRSLSGHRRSLPGHRRSLPGHRRSLPGHRRSLSGHRRSLSGHRRSLSGHRRSLSGHRQSLSGHRQSLSGHRRSLSGHQQRPSAGPVEGPHAVPARARAVRAASACHCRSPSPFAPVAIWPFGHLSPAAESPRPKGAPCFGHSGIGHFGSLILVHSSRPPNQPGRRGASGTFRHGLLRPD